jgi:hypothetical protein
VLQALEVQFPVLDVLQPVVHQTVTTKLGELHEDSLWTDNYSILHCAPLVISATNLCTSTKTPTSAPVKPASVMSDVSMLLQHAEYISKCPFSQIQLIFHHGKMQKNLLTTEQDLHAYRIHLSTI